MKTALLAQQLRKAASIREKIEGLEKQLAALVPVSAGAPAGKATPKRRYSAAARARMAAAATARWAKVKRPGRTGAAALPAPAKPKRRFSPATRAAMAKRLKARWAKVKAAGKKTL